MNGYISDQKYRQNLFPVDSFNSLAIHHQAILNVVESSNRTKITGNNVTRPSKILELKTDILAQWQTTKLPGHYFFWRQNYLLFSVSFRAGAGLHTEGVTRVIFFDGMRLPFFVSFKTRLFSDERTVLPLSLSLCKPFFKIIILCSRLFLVFSSFCLADENFSMLMSYLSVYSNKARPWCTAELSSRPGLSFNCSLKLLKNKTLVCLVYIAYINLYM